MRAQHWAYPLGSPTELQSQESRTFEGFAYRPARVRRIVFGPLRALPWLQLERLLIGDELMRLGCGSVLLEAITESYRGQRFIRLDRHLPVGVPIQVTVRNVARGPVLCSVFADTTPPPMIEPMLPVLRELRAYSARLLGASKGEL